MGALHINGQKTTGLDITLADGVFIDTENVIVAKTSYTPSTFSYIATEDCVLYIEIPAKGGYSTFLEIDGKEVQGVNLAGSSTNYLIATALLKKGQIATLSSSSFPSVTPDYAVYGIQQGTIEGKLQPVIYSTEEREVGVWTDGRPVYQKTLIGTVSVSSTDRAWYTIAQASELSNIDNVVPVIGSYIVDSGDGQLYPIPTTTGVGTGASLSCVYNTTQGLRVCLQGVSAGTSAYSLTIQYTKTTDQAGSGTWTPDGAYAHHYSTDEKVVGTWVDGSTIYEITTDMGTAGVSVGAGASVNSNIPVGNIDRIVYSMAISQSGKYFPVIGAEQGDTYIKMINMGGSNRNVRWFTIQYTKSA